MIESDNVSGRKIPKLDWYEDQLNTLLENCRPPQEVQIGGGKVFRFEEKAVGQAVLLKSIRYVSGLSAGSLLLQHGFFQELCTLQRTLDEMHEDIFFLTLPSFGFDWTENHDRYLESFWEEEPDYKSFSARQKNKWSIPRKSVRSYLSLANPDSEPDHRSISVSGYLGRMYSGYVHASAPQLMELYDDAESKFRVVGFPSSPLRDDHVHDFENQFFRGVMNVVCAARLLDNEAVAKEAHRFHNLLEQGFH